MMKRTVIYTALVAAVLTGCGKENVTPDVTPDGTPVALQLQVGIGSVKSYAATIPGSSFARESKINVVLTDYDGGTANYDVSGVYVYKDHGSDGVWIQDNIASPLELDANGAMVLAHYPAALPSGASYDVTTKLFTPVVASSLGFGDLLAGGYNADNSFWFSFNSGQPQTEIFMADGEIDYMYGKMTNTQAVNNLSKLAQLKMSHCLTMVVFDIFKSDLHPAPCVVKSIKVKNINGATALQSGTFSISDGKFTPTAPQEYSRTMDNFPDNSYFGMMMYPASIRDNQVSVEFLVDDQTYTLRIDECKWESGYANLYRVKLSPIGAELVDVVKVVDWGTGTNKDFEIN